MELLGGGRWVNTRTERATKHWVADREQSRPTGKLPSTRLVLAVAAIGLVVIIAAGLLLG